MCLLNWLPEVMQLVGAESRTLFVFYFLPEAPLLEDALEGENRTLYPTVALPQELTEGQQGARADLQALVTSCLDHYITLAVLGQSQKWIAHAPPIVAIFLRKIHRRLFLSLGVKI